jgi:competence protein ComEC
MRLAILGFVGGASVLQMQASLPGPGVLSGCLLALLLVLAMRRSYARVLAGTLAGFCWAALIAHLALRHELDPANEGRDITVIGTIDSLPYQFEQGARFNFKVEHSIGDFAAPPRVALAWYGEAVDVQPGQRWQLAVRLQRPHGNANPYGFDYEAWLLEQGLRATGYIRTEGGRNRKLDEFVPTPSNLVERCRALLRSRIADALANKEYKGVIVALVIGDQRGIGQSDWALFNRTGIGHLVSISGLHITMVAGLFALLAAALWRRSFYTKAQLPLLIPAQKVAALVGVVVALTYVLLAGFGIPAQRTLYMIAVVSAALWSGRITGVSHVLCVALGVVVLLDPWAMLWPGFWLSFGAVAVILFATAGRQLSPIWLALRTQYVVTIGLVPLSLALFAQVSVVGPIANALAIPLISFVVTPLSLVGSLLPQPLIGWVLGVAHWCVEMLALFLGWIGNAHWSVWAAPVPPAWVFVLATAGTVWALAPRGWPRRWIGLLAWAPLIAAKPDYPAPGHMVVTAFDVGQGTALLIETSRHRLLYDTGPAYTPESNGGNRVIAPYLRARGITNLDAMVVSHADADHAGGALAMLEAIDVDWTVSSLPMEHPIVAASGRHTRCEAGQQWQWDGVQFELLHPDAASYAETKVKTNALSCVLKVSLAGHSILLAGDIEAAQEAELLSRTSQGMAANVLLVPHHGSGTSSTQPFLEAVRPSLAIYQLGYRNRFHHPQRQVVGRYASLGVLGLRTDQHGAITVHFSEKITVQHYREQHRRYWH